MIQFLFVWKKAVLRSFAPAKIQKSVLYRLFRHPAMDSIKSNIGEWIQLNQILENRLSSLHSVPN